MSNKGRSGRVRLGNAQPQAPKRGNAYGYGNAHAYGANGTPKPPPADVLAQMMPPPKDPVVLAKAMPALIVPPPEAPPSSKPASSTNGTANGAANGTAHGKSADRPTLPDAPSVKESVKESPKDSLEAKEQSVTDALVDEAIAKESSKPEKEAGKHDKHETKSRAKARDAGRDKEAKASKGGAGKAKGQAAALDEVSVPPIGDLEAEKFFAEGHAVEREHTRGASQSDAGLELELGPDPKVEHKMRPEVRARRARLTRYVQWTVGVLALLCFAAAVRVAVARGSHESARADIKATLPPAAAAPNNLANSPQTNPASPPAAAAAQPAAAVPAEQAAAQAVAEAKPGEAVPAAADTKPAEGAKPADTAAGAAAEPAAAAADTAAPEKTAAEEKKDARVALERGAFKKAIEAGERSVALDATDGEAWLILGAAYESTGRAGEARRCFGSCLKEGKRGPLGECRAMLR